jgi:hypothetical protein
MHLQHIDDRQPADLFTVMDPGTYAVHWYSVNSRETATAGDNDRRQRRHDQIQRTLRGARPCRVVYDQSRPARRSPELSPMATSDDPETHGRHET